MCYACNPTCGRCRPKRTISVECPTCAAPASLRREEYLLLFDLPHEKNVLEQRLLERGGVSAPVCRVCGGKLTEAFRRAVVPAACKQNGIMCGYPCGRCDEPPEPGAPLCPYAVPLDELLAESGD